MVHGSAGYPCKAVWSLDNLIHEGFNRLSLPVVRIENCCQRIAPHQLQSSFV